ncbi:hypothetical protein ACY4UO_000306 [Campylobacter jejuni]
MKLVDKLKKAYDYKKELYKAEKGSSSKEYHIENAEIFQDFIELEYCNAKISKEDIF